jgi:6-phosphogluconolactonase/glucosamine-6-phosphate isomerase/deaminase
MEIITSDEAAKQAGTYISEVIAEHNGDVVCLLAGGSALDIIPHIKVMDSAKHECRTIFMLGDERGSRDVTINNSLQLVTRYPDSYVAKNLILTVPAETEELEKFTSRILETFLTKTENLKNPKIIQVLGVGLDGHTAGIFPLPIDEFTNIYNRPDHDIVPVHLEGLRIDSRASCTPNYIQSKADELVGYVVGSDKKMILESLINETKSIHERPAELIKRHSQTKLYTDQHPHGM